MFDFIKEEKEKRKKEEAALQESIERERERIAEKRRNAKKSVVRKFKPIDRFQSNREQKADKAELEQFTSNKWDELKQKRTKRTGTLIRDNIGTIAIAAIALIVLIGGGSAFGFNQYQTAKASGIMEQYNQAVAYILEEDYQSASKELENLSVKDSNELREYSNLQVDLEKYRGNTAVLLEKLDVIGVIDNEDVSDQYDEACVEVATVGDIQKEIDTIENDTYSEDSSEQIDIISDEIDGVKERYRVLLDTEKYDQAVETINNVEEKTPVGVAILAINDLDEVSLESEDQIERARADYEELSESEKGEVVNYGELTEAEAELHELKEEEAEKERIKKEKEEKKRKAEEKKKKEAAKKKKEEAEKRRKEEKRQAEAQEITVYKTKTGDKYHVSGCRYLRQSCIPVSLEEAKRYLEPCSVCHPPT